MEQKRLKKATEILFILLKVLESPSILLINHSELVLPLSVSYKGLVSPLLGAVIATWFGHAAGLRQQGSMIS